MYGGKGCGSSDLAGVLALSNVQKEGAEGLRGDRKLLLEDAGKGEGVP